MDKIKEKIIRNLFWSTILFSVLSACGKDEPNNSSAAPVESQNTPEQTEPTENIAAGGTLIFEVNDPNVDPESVEAYIVGQTSLQAEKIVTESDPETAAESEAEETEVIEETKESTTSFKIEGISPGSQDLVVTAGTIQVNPSLMSSKTLGLRLNKITIEEGKSAVKKNLSIPPMGSIHGFARLIEQTNHELITISIPGTNIPMGTTDEQGSFQMQNIPVGEHKLAFSKDGYLTGRILDLVVESNKLTLVQDVELIPDTGSVGSLTIDGGTASTNSLNVRLSINASEDTLLMMISESETFSGASYQSLQTTVDYTFESALPANKTIYIKFSNANGLETTAEASIIVDLEAPIIHKVSINNNASYSLQRNVDIAIESSDISTITQMIVSESATFSGASWQDYQESFKFDLSESDSEKTIYLKVKDSFGYTSLAESAMIILDTSNPPAPSSLTLSPEKSQMIITWNSGGSDTEGFLLVKSLSKITWTPELGTTYAVNDEPTSGVSIIYSGAATNFIDISVSNSNTYFYSVFSYDTSKHYSDALSDSSALEISLLKTITPSDAVENVEISGIYAFLILDTAGFMIYDISDPSSPSLLSTTDPGSREFKDVALWSYYAVFAEGSDGMSIYDVSDPSSPSESATDGTLNNALAVDVQGAYAYFADGSVGLGIYDMSNPASPSPLANLAVQTVAQDIIVRGDYAYIADKTYGLSIIDISTPGTPTTAATLAISGTHMGIDLRGDDLMLADTAGKIHVVNISDPTNPSLRTSYSFSSTINSVRINGNYIYAADYKGVNIYDITEILDPAFAGYFQTTGHANQVKIRGNYAYVADKANGLQILDITATAANPKLLGEYSELGDSFRDIAVKDNTAFLSKGSEGIISLDVSDPSSISVSGTYATTGYASGIAIYQNYLLVADDTSGLVILNITDPANMTLVSSTATSGAASELIVSGNLVYLSAVGNIDIFDISNPVSPSQSGTTTTVANFNNVMLDGSDLYLFFNVGLKIKDVSDPSDIAANTGTLNTSGSAKDGCLDGDYLLMADFANGIVTIDISNKSSPVNRAERDTLGKAQRVICLGKYLIVADHYMGVSIYDKTNPGNLRLMGSYVSPGNGRGLIYKSGKLYVADNLNGMVILDMDYMSQ